MTLSQLFSCGLVQAPFVTSSGLLPRAWNVVSSRVEGIVSHSGNGLIWKVYEESHSNLMIVAFEVKPDFDLKPDLVSSSYLSKEKNFSDFDYLCTKNIPVFSVNVSAVSLFLENRKKLDGLKKSLINSPPRLIVTGHGLGGSIASLFTLLLLGSIVLVKKRPLCITFGSPLVGDKRLQEAISGCACGCPTWSSCFLHVVSCKDPLPLKLLNPHPSAYMPFGAFLLCSDVNSTCFEYPESVLEFLVGLIYDQKQGFQPVDYGDVVENLYRKAIYKVFTPGGLDLTHSNSLRASINLQLWELGLTPHMQQQQKNIDMNNLVTKMEELEKKFILQKTNKFDPSKKLSSIKTEMARLESYKKDSKNQNIGYYDSYKRSSLTSDYDVVKSQKTVTNYWKEIVEKIEMKPQREGAELRARWLYAGTNYRRMVEPLDIAEYYAKGGKDYVTYQRSRHYVLLEEWLNEKGKEDPSDSASTSRRIQAIQPSDSASASRGNVESILTTDSCFWAYVEEALLLCEQLKSVQSSVEQKEEATMKLREFEEYVYGLLRKYKVSPEIFLEHSSYMTWWNQYRAIRGTSHNSPLVGFMSDPRNYVQYAKGTYVFPQV